MQRDRNDHEDQQSSLQLSPEEIEELRSDHQFLEEQKNLATREADELAEELINLQEHSHQEDDVFDMFNPFADDHSIMGDEDDLEEDFLGDYDPDFWPSWGKDEKDELNSLRELNKTLSHKVQEMKAKKLKLFLGVNKDHLQRDKEMMDCRKKYLDHKENEKFSRPMKSISFDNMTEGEHQLYLLKRENEKLSSELHGGDIQELEKEIVRLKQMLSPDSKEGEAERKQELKDEIKQIQRDGGEQRRLLKLIQEHNNILQKERSDALKKKQKMIDELKEELAKKG
jgi:hypothetical protein